MKSIFISLMLLFVFTNLFAQSDNCAFKPTKKRFNYLKNNESRSNKVYQLLKQIERNKLPFVERIEKKPDGILRPIIRQQVIIKMIPIVAHILRESDGAGGLASQTLTDAVIEANNRFRGTGLQFRVCETKYIDDNVLFNTNYDDQIAGVTKSYDVLDVVNKNVPRKINVYFYPTGRTSWAYGVDKDTKKQHIMMLNGHVGNTVTLAHELAHWLDLAHTHGRGGFTQELVNGSNCAIEGDLVCDTPADPLLSGQVDANCQYIPNAALVDANGQQFTPDPTNLMSYATRSCRVGFSSQQICRMLSAYFTMKADRGYTLKACNLIGLK